MQEASLGRLGPRTTNLGQRHLKAISSLSWSAQPSTPPCIHHGVYKGYVRAILDWGAQLLRDTPGSHLARLDSIQVSALRTCLGCIKTAPNNVTFHLGGLPPFQIRWLELTTNYIYKIRANQGNTVIPKLQLMEILLDRRRRNPGPPGSPQIHAKPPWST
ncbi:uncharacterized protein LOC124404694 [Diprion similis]|uniref:uncharacterized protein LOC124404694 n=1 Tax=Diprion similis TaxID=362088 RepID=UPI001EF93FD9|nr:uncharacterized protein LOC124404694 [Diprion similis]